MNKNLKQQSKSLELQRKKCIKQNVEKETLTLSPSNWQADQNGEKKKKKINVRNLNKTDNYT